MNKQFNNFFIGLVFAFLLTATTAVRAETFYAYLTGAQENPPVATGGSGYARIILDESAGMISFTVVYNNLSSAQTASHIHDGVIGVNGPVVINLGASGGTSGTVVGTAAITAPQIAQLRAHQFYVNVHTTNNTGGELRGQLGNKRPVDFDGDGRTDYSVLRFPGTSPNTITWYNLNSTNGFETFVHGDANTDTPVPGDYDGDGEDDFAVYRDGSNPGDQSFHLIIKSSDFTLLQYPWGINGDQPINRDYDGDGITDVAIFRRGASAGQQAVWYIRQSSDSSAFIVPWGTTGSSSSNGDTPVPGDYDGDGKFDIAVYRFGGISPNNHFIVLQSSNGAAVFVQWGDFTTDYVVPGDYDGDGKFDYAVARTGATAGAQMVWWIRRSSDNGTTVQPFGISSDLPTQGDYDGDARTDIAIYRRGATAGSQSVFWILNSLNGTATATPWGLQTDFPLAAFDVR